MQVSKAKELTVPDVADENVVKEAQAGNATVYPGARGFLTVQCIEKHGQYKVFRPNHRWRCDNEALENPTYRKANQLG